MQFTKVSIFMSLLAVSAVASPLAPRQASVDGQACTDGTFDGTCRADGRCGLEIPPNEVSFRNIGGQCGLAENNSNPLAGLFGGNNNANAGNANTGNAATDDTTDDAATGASVDGQACTDGTFDGTCRADGRCGLEIPPNEVSFRQIGGQCGL
ncbi:uncharacterized protein F4822DRAFT_275647 [Hypoxylon trugodes]|uniref:uncharacterized protein n=1 Tax=Hypoxylon trugodes TaxID=326681 RepID=UPI00218F496F|nr:uncharacterized protein F4822DRAFT_275647 [Hypoxylon trugodes]KAI1387163.1 hypothetical protein F4822DRAFT_275647 [Hypoxylon trugodes]